jgi:hypothetical protein
VNGRSQLPVDNLADDVALGSLGEHAITEQILRPRYGWSGDFGGGSAILLSGGHDIHI